MYAHICRIQFPAVHILLGIWFRYKLKKLHKISKNYQVAFNEKKYKLPIKPAQQIINGMPKLVTRSDKWIEFDFHRVLEETAFVDDCSQNRYDSALIIGQSFFSNMSSEMKKLYELHRTKKGKKTLLWHGDVLSEKPKDIDFFKKKVDLIVHFNPKVRNLITSQEDLKEIVWPGLPFPERLFESITKEQQKKIPKLLFSGSNHRFRRTYSDYAMKLVPSEVALHGRNNVGNSQVSYRDYLKELGRYQLVFSSGYYSRKESIVVGRVWEAILLGTVVLYESGSWLDYYLKPYEHYIPIFNRNDLVHKANFLLENPQYLDVIARKAFHHYIENFSSEKFWNLVANNL
jgi:hypothetical protein